MPSIAVIGASADRAKYGNKAVRAYVSMGWTVYPVNPKLSEVEGLPCFSSISEVPTAPDFASLYVPPAVGIGLLPAIAKAGVKKVYVNPGAESMELIEEAERLGLEPIVACSIRALGLAPERV